MVRCVGGKRAPILHADCEISEPLPPGVCWKGNRAGYPVFAAPGPHFPFWCPILEPVVLKKRHKMAPSPRTLDLANGNEGGRQEETQALYLPSPFLSSHCGLAASLY